MRHDSIPRVKCVIPVCDLLQALGPEADGEYLGKEDGLVRPTSKTDDALGYYRCVDLYP